MPLKNVNVALELHTKEGKECVPFPTYQHETDAGMDIYASEDVTLAPGETALVHTGMKVAIPEGYEIQVRTFSQYAFACMQCTWHNRFRIP